MNGKVEKLVSKYRWHEWTAKAHVRDEGKCMYCGTDLLSSRLGYSSMSIDHLLPKSKYENQEWEHDNWITCCVMCNGMKGAFDPLIENEDPVSMLKNNRRTLIDRVRDYLKESIEKQNRDYEGVKNIIIS